MKNLIKKIIPPFLINWYHFLLAFLGAILYRFPSCPPKFSFGKFRWARKIKVIGVTGTNGKSTVVEMTSKILEEAGYKIASLSSIKFKIAGKEWPNTLKMTMPGRFQIQKFLRRAVDSGCQYAILEVTSEGILQHRHRFIDFEAAVFTNLSPEHIERHGSFENYRAAKGKLFRATKNIHIINIDDENVGFFFQFPANQKWLYTSAKDNFLKQSYRLVCSTILSESQPLTFSIGQTVFKLNLLGKFNIYNALAAICVGLSQGISLEACKSALEKIKGIPGRMEEVISQPFKVFVDYAFTPNALQKVYQTLSGNSKFQNPNSKMICVLGACGGGRDKWKRPVLGEIAAKYCQEIIVTDEDPYDEDPMEIIEQVAKGTGGKAKKILDRREAIRESLELAQADDIVVITGKGCEPWMCLRAGKKIPWDDRIIVREEFSK